VFFEPDTSADQMADALATHQPNVLVVRSTKVSAAAIQAGEKLALIVRAGAGYDTIDVAEASRRGVYLDPGLRSSNSRPNRRSTSRQMEQKGICQGRWSDGPNTGHYRDRTDRYGDCPAGQGVWDERGWVES